MLLLQWRQSALLAEIVRNNVWVLMLGLGFVLNYPEPGQFALSLFVLRWVSRI
jgi:hypothetical protein